MGYSEYLCAAFQFVFTLFFLAPIVTHFTSRLARLRSLPVAAFFLGLSVATQGQTVTPIAISSATAIYSQNFNSMGVTGASSTAYPTGWAGIRIAGTGTANDPLAPVVVLAGSNSGAVYNAGPFAGTPNETDRALGSLASGSTVPAFGAAFRNETGTAVTRVNIAARMEQWRSGSVNTVNEITEFEYSLDATSLSTGTWTAVTALDLVERATSTTTAAALDGNDAANRTAISSSITGINWANNTTMWIRWKDTDNTGSDALLAVDDFALSVGTVALSNRNKLNSSVSVFPNPVADVVTIRTGGSASVQVTVTDLMGRVVLTGRTTTNGTFDTSTLKAGTYIVELMNGAEKSTQRVTKL
jgi:hypothetical protein